MPFQYGFEFATVSKMDKHCTCVIGSDLSNTAILPSWPWPQIALQH